MKNEMLKIGEVAALAGTVSNNIRFYEQKGLIPVPIRSKGRYRLYRTDTVDRIRFIIQAKGLGFSLPEIRELLDLSDNPESC